MSVQRFVAIGDPQAPFGRVVEMLRSHHLLGPDGRLRPEVSLLSIGDHFDFPGSSPEQSGRDAVALVEWLASHPPDQVGLLLGNHDTARVQELVTLSDERFVQARALALEHRHLRDQLGRAAPEARALKRQFLEQFPEIPTPGLAARDFDSYHTSQRSLVMRLLLEGRFRLARAARLPDGREILLTHAAVTDRELEILGVSDERRPSILADRLNRWLDEAVEKVRPAWEAGRLEPLDLAPLHVPGAAGQEGGGLLYHRPTNPDRGEHGAPPADPAWELAAERPRRYHPRELPRGLVQACGHTGHRKCLHELVPWVSPEAQAMRLGGLRTLRAGSKGIEYLPGVQPGEPDEATLILLDGELVRLEDPRHYAVLELGGWG